MTLERRKIGWIGAAVVAGLSVAVATTALANAATTNRSDTSEARPVPTTAPDPDYSRNASGETYGSAVEAGTPEQEPDLILVVSDQGHEGYVRKTELYPPTFADPQEALEWQSEVGAKARVLTVYASDGKTRVGTFTIDPGTGTEVEPPSG